MRWKLNLSPHQTPVLRVKPSVWLRAPLSRPQSRRATPDRLLQSTPPAFCPLYLVGHYRRQIYSLHVVQWLSRVQLFVTPYGRQHARLSCPSLSPRVCSKPHPLSQWCHPTISSSVAHFSSCPQSFPESGSLPRSQFFTSGGQSIGVSASAWVLPVNIQGWFPLGLTGWISLQSKGLSESSLAPQFESINSSVLSLL